MSTTEHPTHRCPECQGPRLTFHPAGLVFRHDTECPLLAREDSTAAADAERASYRGLPGFWRETTPTEVELLTACGVTLKSGAMCEAYWLTPSIRRRRWDGVRLDAEPPRML